MTAGETGSETSVPPTALDRIRDAVHQHAQDIEATGGDLETAYASASIVPYILHVSGLQLKPSPDSFKGAQRLIYYEAGLIIADNFRRHHSHNK